MSINFPAKIDFDFALPLEEALAFCKEREVVASEEFGPGGGNPNVTMLFHSDEELREFCDKYANGDPDMFDEIYECQTERVERFPIA